MNTIGSKVCKRCLQEKPDSHFFNDDRGVWCMLCVYQFLLAHGDDPTYEDAREFTHPTLRNVSRSPSWVLARLRPGIENALGLKLGASQRKQASHTPDTAERMADATRIPGERAFVCDICHEKYGGETIFKAHRKYSNKPGRPSPNATLKCFSLEGTKYTKDENGVWRSPTPIFK